MSQGQSPVLRAQEDVARGIFAQELIEGIGHHTELLLSEDHYANRLHIDAVVGDYQCSHTISRRELVHARLREMEVIGDATRHLAQTIGHTLVNMPTTAFMIAQLLERHGDLDNFTETMGVLTDILKEAGVTTEEDEQSNPRNRRRPDGHPR